METPGALIPSKKTIKNIEENALFMPESAKSSFFPLELPGTFSPPFPASLRGSSRMIPCEFIHQERSDKDCKCSRRPAQPSRSPLAGSLIPRAEAQAPHKSIKALNNLIVQRGCGARLALTSVSPRALDVRGDSGVGTGGHCHHPREVTVFGGWNKRR